MFERVVQVRRGPGPGGPPEEAPHLRLLLSQTVIYGAGGRVGFFQGDIRLLPDDMKALQPTVFPAVPRLLNRIYNRVSRAPFCLRLTHPRALTSDPPLFPQVQSGANTPFKRWLLNFAVDRKYGEVKDGVVRNDSLWDKLVFHRVQVGLRPGERRRRPSARPDRRPSLPLSPLQASLGGRVRVMVTGAAPISPSVLTFLRAALGCQVTVAPLPPP